MPTTVLFLAANPSDTERLALPREVNAISDRLYDTGLGGDEKLGSSFRLEQRWDVKASELPSVLDRFAPTIVHFSSHGERSGEIILTGDDGAPFLVSNDALANVFRNAARGVRCVVLNACHSEPLARALAEHVDCVVGMTRAVLDSDAIAFAGAFYAAIGRGASVKAAFDRGCNQIELAHPSGGAGKKRDLEPDEGSPPAEEKVPVLVTRAGVDPSKLVFVAPEKRPFPWLPVLVVLAALLGVGGGGWLLSQKKPDPKRDAVPTASTPSSVPSAAPPVPPPSSSPKPPDPSAPITSPTLGPARACAVDLSHIGRFASSTCQKTTRPVSLGANQLTDLKSSAAYKDCGSFTAYRCPSR